MKALRHDPAQRFTCARCTRCCRHFDVAVTEEEAQRLRRPALARLWSATTGATIALQSDDVGDPLESAPGGLLRLRRRTDGACGFLAEDGACRIHAGPGADQKPLACRIFPFRVHATEAAPLVAASFSCPTVARNEGEPLAHQLGALGSLAKSWRRSFPEETPTLRFSGQRSLAGAVAGEMRGVFCQCDCARC
jgi:lysine-N-methylase